MKQDMHFWLTMLARGFIALLAGSFVLVIPDMAHSLLLLPFALAVSVVGLASYGVIDSVIVLISSFMAERPSTRAVLLTQGSVGIVIGVLLLSVAFDRVQLEWFLTLAALQALAAGAGELVIARHTATHATSVWNSTAGVVALCAGLACVVLRAGFASALTPGQIAWLVYAYLVAFGIAQCLTAARMIYADRKLMQHAAPTAAPR